MYKIYSDEEEGLKGMEKNQDPTTIRDSEREDLGSGLHDENTVLKSSKPKIAFFAAAFVPVLALLILFVLRELAQEKVAVPTTVEQIQSVQANPQIGGDLLNGQTITVHYEVWLAKTGEAGFEKGNLVDSSRQIDKPFSFTLGGGQIFEGWDKAIATMQRGEKRTVFVPAAQAYGKEGIKGKIPPNADLILEVEVLESATN